MANKPIIPFNPNGPVLSASNDTGDTKPYVGKPKPMSPTTRPPGMGYSPGGGSFDASSLRRAPRPTMILPGQGQGPMPVGTKPLPSPVVKDARGGGGIDFEKLNDPFYRGVRAPSPEEIAQHEADRAAGRLGGPTSDTGDNRLNRGGIGPIGYGDNDQMRPGGFGPRGGMVGINNDPRYGGGKEPWIGGVMMGPDGNGGYKNFNDPSTQPGNPEFRNWGLGGPRDNNAGRLSQQAIANGLMDDRGYPGAQFGGTQVQMKPMGQGGQQVQPGMGMPTQYGGGPSGRGGVEVPYDGMNGAVQRGPGAPGMPSGGKPPQGPQPGMPGRGGGQRPQRPQQGGGANPQAMQQGAQALYSDNTIPHEFKGQLLQAAQSGNAQAFNEMLFNSNIPHETKLKLQQMFGYGGQGGGVQAATPDQLTQQVQGVTDAYNGSKGSPYYGAF